MPVAAGIEQVHRSNSEADSSSSSYFFSFFLPIDDNYFKTGYKVSTITDEHCTLLEASKRVDVTGGGSSGVLTAALAMLKGLTQCPQQLHWNSEDSDGSRHEHHIKVIPSQVSQTNNQNDHTSTMPWFDRYGRQPVLIGCIGMTPSDQTLFDNFPHWGPWMRVYWHLVWSQIHARELHWRLLWLQCWPSPPRCLTRDAAQVSGDLD